VCVGEGESQGQTVWAASGLGQGPRWIRPVQVPRRVDPERAHSRREAPSCGDADDLHGSMDISPIGALIHEVHRLGWLCGMARPAHRNWPSVARRTSSPSLAGKTLRLGRGGLSVGVIAELGTRSECVCTALKLRRFPIAMASQTAMTSGPPVRSARCAHGNQTRISPASDGGTAY
jgi:hypothetical protein